MGQPQFPLQQADALIDQLQQAITMLNQQTHDRIHNATGLQQNKNWTGQYADEFYNTEIPRMQNQAGGLGTRMQNALKAMQGAQQQASNDLNQYNNELIYTIAENRYKETHRF